MSDLLFSPYLPFKNLRSGRNLSFYCLQLFWVFLRNKHSVWNSFAEFLMGLLGNPVVATFFLLFPCFVISTYMLFILSEILNVAFPCLWTSIIYIIMSMFQFSINWVCNWGPWGLRSNQGYARMVAGGYYQLTLFFFIIMLIYRNMLLQQTLRAI